MGLSTPSPWSPDNQIDFDELERLNHRVLVLQKTIYDMYRIVGQSASWSSLDTIAEK